MARVGAQCGPASLAQAQDPCKGPSLAGRTTGGFLRSNLIRQAHEEAEISRQGTSRGAHDASRDDRDQAGAGLRSVLVSSLVQRGQAQAWSTEALGKGFHISATRPRPAERQDEGHRGAQDGIITSAFGSRRPPLVRITCTRCSPSKWPIVGALPAHYLGRGPGPL